MEKKFIHRCMHGLLLLAMMFTFAGCDDKKTPDEIFSDLSSGVVVVLNEYYYEIKLPDGTIFYCNGVDEDGDLTGLTVEKKEIESNRSVMTGTAFFIKNDGTMLTNRHVATPEMDKSELKNGMVNILKGLRYIYSMQMNNLTEQYTELESEKSSCVYTDYYGNQYVNQERYNEIQAQQQELSAQYDECRQIVENASSNIDPASITITPVCELGIAYNNTYVTSEKDFIDRNPCVVVRTSKDKDVDLALLQLKNQKTPDDKHLFHFAGEEQGGGLFDAIKSLFVKKRPTTLAMDQQLYMIGYNAGLVLANTKQGIKVQMTSGKVSQMPDGQRLLYTIPTMKGSSGSPVVDEYGSLVAVNFAKLVGTDNFNFGIPENKIKAFLAEQ